MGIQDMARKRVDMFMMDPAKLKIEDGWNVRQHTPELEAHIDWLKESIKSEGVKEPLTVYMKDGEPFVTNGYCRLAAVKKAISEGSEILTVPVRVEERYASEPDRVLSMITRNGGKPLTALETAEVCKRLLAFGWEKEMIAKKAGFSVTHINNILGLSANSKVAGLVKDGSVAPSLAIRTLAEHGPKETPYILEKAVQKAKGQGKTRATARHIGRPLNWGAWGKQFHAALKRICDMPIKDPRMGEAIAAGSELLEKFDLVEKAENGEIA